MEAWNSIIERIKQVHVSQIPQWTPKHLMNHTNLNRLKQVFWFNQDPPYSQLLSWSLHSILLQLKAIHSPSTFETWWTTRSLVFLESISLSFSRSGTSSSVKFTNFNTAPVLWATNCQGTIALWCSATVSTTWQLETKPFLVNVTDIILIKMMCILHKHHIRTCNKHRKKLLHMGTLTDTHCSTLYMHLISYFAMCPSRKQEIACKIIHNFFFLSRISRYK